MAGVVLDACVLIPASLRSTLLRAAAVAVGAETIVTTNLRDFPLASLAPFAIDVQSPDAFLCNLADLALDRLREVIQQQAAALRHPPLTVDELLDKLAVHTPQFVEILRTR